MPGPGLTSASTAWPSIHPARPTSWAKPFSNLEATGQRLADFSVEVGDGGSGAFGTSLAVDSTQSVWVSGLFGDHAKFGTITLDGAAPPYPGTSVTPFVVRLDPMPSP